MYSQLAAILENQVNDVSAVILSGGSDFTAGNDLADFLQKLRRSKKMRLYTSLCAPSPAALFR